MAEQGNNAAMREALVAAKKSIDGLGASSLGGDPEILIMSLTQVCARLSSRIEAALSEPPRNCDVCPTLGVAENRWFLENAERHIADIRPFDDWLFDRAALGSNGN